MHARHINTLPFQRINALLGLKLKTGRVHLSLKTIRHVMQKHRNDATLCFENLDKTVAQPDFVGQEPHHLENFEVIKRVEGVVLLVAIHALADAHGDHAIKSCYIIPEAALQRRLRKQHVIACQ